VPRHDKKRQDQKYNGQENQHQDRIPFSTDRRQVQGTERLAGRDARSVRALIKQADPDVVEEWKWRGVPVWFHDGIICTRETYKSVVKLTFAKGAALKDPSRLFNSSLEGNVRRAIDIHEDDKIDATALKALIRAAVVLNKSKAK
jgi:hypothetical protein